MFNTANMRLNSLSAESFEVKGADEKVGELSRNKIIASGRACAADYLGRNIAAARGDKSSYKSLCDAAGVKYEALSRNHSIDKYMYCASRAYAVVGKNAPTDFNTVKNDTSLWKDPVFLKTLSSIDSEVVTPLLYSVFSDVGNRLMKWDTVPLGQTKEITVRSNDVFFFEDSAWGSAHSATKNYLYNDTITITPTPKTANATIKWFQMVADDNGLDAGWYYTAIMQGMYSKIMAMFTNKLVSAASNTAKVPSYLAFNSYSSANWGNATTLCAAANGVNRDALMAFGAYQALSKVLPSGTSSDAALTYNLGPEWMRDGFLAMVGRVPLYEIQPAFVPGTVNTTGTTIFPNDMIFIAPRWGEALAPVYGVFAEGSPITIEHSASDTADFSIDINVTAIFGVEAVCAGKIAVIDNV